MNNLINKKFGRLTVIKYIGKNKYGHNRWLCKCQCDKLHKVYTGNLTNGHTQSCGCLNKENKLKHGHSKKGKISRAYIAWQNMKARCGDKNITHIKYYSKRNIKICKRWLKFENFYKDVGNPPKGKSLDRINNNKGYYPNNWRWATKKEQSRNQKNNITLKYNGKIERLINLAEKHGIKLTTLQYRLNNGYSIEKALTTPVQKHIKRRK